MRFKSILFVILFALGSLFSISGAAEAKPARVKWNGVILDVVSHVPSSWQVNAAMADVDWYTGSDMHLVSKCSSAHRCVVISNGRVSGAAVGMSHGCISIMPVCNVTIDVAKANRRHFSSATKRYLIRHELGHYRGLPDRKACDSTMNPYVKCHGHVPPNTFTSAQRNVLRRM